MSSASDDIPSVIIHPPEEDLEVQDSQEKKTEENIGKTPGNYQNLSYPCVMLSASGSLALQCFLAHNLGTRGYVNCYLCLHVLFILTCDCFLVWHF